MLDLSFAWRCPNCQSRLEKNNSVWSCTNRHSFDIAKQGYVNLLLANQRNSKNPGDSKEMINARHHFLSQGHYAFLADKLGKIVKWEIGEHKTIHFADIGCGEAYYLNHIVEQVLKQNDSNTSCGIDISKAAITQAAKTCGDVGIELAVASSFEIPLPSNSQDIVLQIFAPCDPKEVKRVLTNQGKWLLVKPSSEHLFELKSLVYDTPQKHKVEDNAYEDFDLIDKYEIRQTIALDTVDLRLDLLAMTPFFWTITENKKQTLLKELVSVTAHFDITLLTPKN